MGWREGLGLGKNNLGPLAPLQLSMKKDRKGQFNTDSSLAHLSFFVSISVCVPVYPLICYTVCLLYCLRVGMFSALYIVFVSLCFFVLLFVNI